MNLSHENIVTEKSKIEKSFLIVLRIKELSKKVNTARRFGRNPDMLAQLQLAMNTYRNAIRERRLEEWHKNNKKLRGEPDLGDLVNID